MQVRYRAALRPDRLQNSTALPAQARELFGEQVLSPTFFGIVCRSGRGPRRAFQEKLHARPAGAEGQNRTGDTAVFSRVLYQLSYLGARAMVLKGPIPVKEEHGD